MSQILSDRLSGENQRARDPEIDRLDQEITTELKELDLKVSKINVLLNRDLFPEMKAFMSVVQRVLKSMLPLMPPLDSKEVPKEETANAGSLRSQQEASPGPTPVQIPELTSDLAVNAWNESMPDEKMQVYKGPFSDTDPFGSGPIDKQRMRTSNDSWPWLETVKMGPDGPIKFDLKEKLAEMSDFQKGHTKLFGESRLLRAEPEGQPGSLHRENEPENAESNDIHEIEPVAEPLVNLDTLEGNKQVEPPVESLAVAESTKRNSLNLQETEQDPSTPLLRLPEIPKTRAFPELLKIPKPLRIPLLAGSPLVGTGSPMEAREVKRPKKSIDLSDLSRFARPR